ncbi:TIGR03668 family PPOX class F420-dependent oxidoreductase [Streptomyces sp. NPDC004237]|uniref:TIGR03668 family PPOX class F420-dependent oxidoreductase n=1 Tax=Streptomyces sp. NPDC004237 TaxID=3154455 RepID=UPI0033BD66C4
MPELSEDEARRRFTAARVARLATVDEIGRPHLVPVVFARYGADGIVTAVDHKPKTTLRLKRLRNIAARPSVSLLVDVYDDENWDRLWWVRADGDATLLSADAAVVEPLCEKYPQYRERPPNATVVLVTVSRWTGWQAAPF